MNKLLIILMIVGCTEKPVAPRKYHYNDLILFSPGEQTEFFNCLTESAGYGVLGRIKSYEPMNPTDEIYYLYEAESLCTGGKTMIQVRQGSIGTSCSEPIEKDAQGYCNCYNPHGVQAAVIPCDLDL